MPILEIQIVLRPNESVSQELAVELADRTGAIFGSPPGTTWVKIQAIPRENYAENGGGPAEDVYPVFVSILKARLPEPATWPVEVALLTTAIAQVCGRPEANVHLFYLPEGAGRIAFGGSIVNV
jgi:phenylpyruvate tautomerase PptA (4-oxalocrotonate tautomerase family)